MVLKRRVVRVDPYASTYCTTYYHYLLATGATSTCTYCNFN